MYTLLHYLYYSVLLLKDQISIIGYTIIFCIVKDSIIMLHK